MTSAASRLFRVSAATAIAIVISATPASAAGFMYFKDAPIAGVMANSNDPGRIEVESWQWGVARVGGKMHLEDISLGAARQAGAKGGNVEFEWKVEEGESAPPPPPRGSLSVKVPAGTCKAGARYPTVQFGTNKRLYRMTGAVVSGCGTARSADGGIPTETLSLNFDKISWKYWPAR